MAVTTNGQTFQTNNYKFYWWRRLLKDDAENFINCNAKWKFYGVSLCCDLWEICWKKYISIWIHQVSWSIDPYPPSKLRGPCQRKSSSAAKFLTKWDKRENESRRQFSLSISLPKVISLSKFNVEWPVAQ